MATVRAIRQDFPTDGGEYSQGATIKNIKIDVTIGGAPPTSPVVYAAIALQDCGKIVHRYDSDENTITVDPAGDSITIVEHILLIPAAEYKYDLFLRFADGTTTRWMFGIWRLAEAITLDNG